MRVRHTLNPVVTEDSDGKSRLFALNEVTAEAVLDGFQRQTSGVTDLVDTEVYAIPYADLTDARGLFLRMDGGDMDVSINGNPALQVRRGATGTGGAKFANCKLLLEAQTTSLQVTAVGGGRLSWCLWGDPVA